jgi:hypothetical protein
MNAGAIGDEGLLSMALNCRNCKIVEVVEPVGRGFDGWGWWKGLAG